MAVAAAMLVSLGPVVSRAAASPRLATPDGIVVSPCSGDFEGDVAFPKGSKLVSETQIQLCATGHVTVAFAGSRSAGCAAHGLCGYHGTEMWNAQGAGAIDLFTIARRGHRSTLVLMSVGGFDRPVRSLVSRRRRGEPPATCQDRGLGAGGLGEAEPPASRGRVVIRLGASGLTNLGTRCAGPLVSDIASVLPRRAVSLARLRRGNLTIDLSGSSHFRAHGFSGTVTSTVTLALAAPHRAHDFPTGTGNGPGRIATALYRVAQLSGSTTASVRGGGTHAACARLDACGLRGTITVTPRPRRKAQVMIQAGARHRRSQRDLLTALGLPDGGNTKGIQIFGDGFVSTGIPGRVRVAQGATPTPTPCTEPLPLDSTGLRIRPVGGHLQAQLTLFSTTGTDPLRTRCPGPMLGIHALARASLPLSILRQPRFTMRMHGASFHDGPYDVATHSTIAITLSRQSVTTGPPPG